MTQKDIASKFKGDVVIWITILILCVFSVLAVYSGIGKMAMRANDVSKEYLYLWRHVFIMVSGLILMWVVHLVNWHKFLQKTGFLFLVIACILLIVTMFFGTEKNGAKRWIDLGVFLVQTSDIAKLALVVYLSGVFANIKEFETDFKQMLKWVYAPVCITCALIAKADNSTAMLLFAVVVLLMFFARIPMKKILTMMGICVIGVACVFLTLTVWKKIASDDNKPKSETRVDTGKSRIVHFLFEDRIPYEQDYMATLAVAEGGALGKMPGKSEHRFYLPNIESDYIFAIIVEEYGSLLGIFFIIVPFLVLTYRGIKIALKSSRPFSAYLVLGITFMYVLQAFINIGVSVDVLPITGQPMPFVSRGGSMFIMCCLAFGLVLSESRMNAEEKMAAEKITDEKME